MEMLKLINLSEFDVLYVVGDVVDIGPQPIEVLQDMSYRANVIPIIGNHDYIACKILNQLSMELTEENVQEHYGSNLTNFNNDMSSWEAIGGSTTMEGFGKLSKEEREGILEYLSDFSMYEIVTVDDQVYILTHIGLPKGSKPDNLDDYDAYDFIGPDIHTDYNRMYYTDIILVTGHIPTFEIDEKYRGKIYGKKNNLALDAGAGYGEALACYCLETDKEYYIPIED